MSSVILKSRNEFSGHKQAPCLSAVGHGGHSPQEGLLRPQTLGPWGQCPHTPLGGP